MSDEALRRLRSMVEREARRLIRRLPPNVERDDLVQAGMMGALEALARHQPGCASLETYAAHRARGAMLDELRREDPLSRDQRRGQRARQVATERLEHRVGRPPRRAEVAAELGWSEEQMRVTDGDAQTVECEHAEWVPDPGPDPLAALLDRERDALLQAELARLPGRPREVLRLLLEGDLTGHDVGVLFGVSRSRISQITAAAAAQIRARLDALAEPCTAAAPPEPPLLSPTDLAAWAGVRVG